jgi:hypothetical protein
MKGLAGLLPGFQHGAGHIGKMMEFMKKDPETGIETLSPSAGYGGMGRKGWLYNQMKLRSALPPQIVAPALFDEVAGEIRIPDVLHLDEMIEAKKAKATAALKEISAMGRVDPNLGKPQWMPMQHNDIVGNPMIDRPSDPTKAKYVPGFLDSEGKFLDRTDAAERAIATGQVTEGSLRRNVGAHSPWLNLDSFDMRDMRGERGWHTLSPSAWENMVEKVGDRDNLKIRMSDHLNIVPNRPSWWQKQNLPPGRDSWWERVAKQGTKKGVQSGLPLIGAFIDLLLTPEESGAGTVTRNKFTNEEMQKLMEANDDLTRQRDSVIGFDSAVDRISNMPHSRVYPRAY